MSSGALLINALKHSSFASGLLLNFSFFHLVWYLSSLDSIEGLIENGHLTSPELCICHFKSGTRVAAHPNLQLVSKPLLRGVT